MQRVPDEEADSLARPMHEIAEGPAEPSRALAEPSAKQGESCLTLTKAQESESRTHEKNVEGEYRFLRSSGDNTRGGLCCCACALTRPAASLGGAILLAERPVSLARTRDTY